MMLMKCEHASALGRQVMNLMSRACHPSRLSPLTVEAYRMPEHTFFPPFLMYTLMHSKDYRCSSCHLWAADIHFISASSQSSFLIKSQSEKWDDKFSIYFI